MLYEMVIPCEKCIALAICRNKLVVHCKDLYTYLVKYDDNGFIGYRRGCAEEVNALFHQNKYILSSQFDTWRIEFRERTIDNE